MRKRMKLGRAFGLSVLSVLGLMAMFAGSAQATAGEYFVGALGSFLLATFTGAQEGSGTELVPGRALSVTCTTGAINNGHLASKTDATVEISYSGCSALKHPDGKPLDCTVDEPMVITAKMTPFLHSDGKKYVTLEPTGDTFGSLILLDKAPGFCAIKGTYPLKGKVSAEVTTNHEAKNLIKFSSGFSELVKDTLKFGAFAATWNESYTLELTGVHAGKAWGVV